jgi:hypothetical protein
MKTALSALPTLHINGTSGKNLLQVNRAALTAVQEAYRTIQQAAPHSRDFYVQANSAETWKQAHAEHVARLVALEKVRKELEAICLHVIDSGKAA